MLLKFCINFIFYKENLRSLYFEKNKKYVMKTVQFLFLIFFSSLFLFSCVKESESEDSATLWFGNGPNLITKNNTLFVSDTFQVQIIANNGTHNLSQVTFHYDSIQVEIDTNSTNSSILSIQSLNSDAKYNGNPIVLSNSDQRGFTTNWTFIAKQPVKDSTNSYLFFLEDTEGKKINISLDLVVLPRPEPTEETTE